MSARTKGLARDKGMKPLSRRIFRSVFLVALTTLLLGIALGSTIFYFFYGVE